MRSKFSKAPSTAPLRPESDARAGNAKRRGFLLALGAGGIGAAAIAARSLTGTAPAAAGGESDTAPGAGYRETSHVKRYYRTAKT
jgi:hypothetical protein